MQHHRVTGYRPLWAETCSVRRKFCLTSHLEWFLVVNILGLPEDFHGVANNVFSSDDEDEARVDRLYCRQEHGAEVLHLCLIHCHLWTHKWWLHITFFKWTNYYNSCIKDESLVKQAKDLYSGLAACGFSKCLFSHLKVQALAILIWTKVKSLKDQTRLENSNKF